MKIITRIQNERILKIKNLIKYDHSIIMCQFILIRMGGSQCLEQSNVERPIFRNCEISNIKITKDELFDFLFSNLLFIFILV